MLSLPLLPQRWGSGSTVAPTLRKWDKAIRENRFGGLFYKKICMHLNISFDFSSILYWTFLKAFDALFYL